MELLVERTTKTANSTIGEFSIDGNFFSYCLEPFDHGLTSDMTLDQIKAIKVQNKTAIPLGRYEVTKYFSPKRNKDVPLLNEVPGFGFIEIHVGNSAADTDGCLLLGSIKSNDFIGNSTDTIQKFYDLFFDTLLKEKVYITYKDK